MSHKFEPLPLDSAENCKCWLIAFEAHCRVKSIEDKIDPKVCVTSPKTDIFLELCGSKTLLKLISLLSDKDIEAQLFSNIKKCILEYVEPRKRLQIADRTNFLQMSQLPSENEVDYLSRLNEASMHCGWDDLKKVDPTEELIKLRFTSGLRDEKLKLRILEKIQLKPSSNMEEIIDFCQMSAQLAYYVQKRDDSIKETDSFFVQKLPKVNPCSRCGTKHRFKECPAFGKTCNNCQRKNHFARCCNQEKQVRYPKSATNKQNSESDMHSIDIFAVGAAGEAMMQTLVICNTPLDFQIDSGSAISVLSKKQWEKINCPTLEATCVTPTNFDGSQIKTFGCLNIKAQRDDTVLNAKFYVVDSCREFGLIGRDLIDRQKSNLFTFAIDDFLPSIKGFMASIQLVDESQTLRFCKARSVPVHLKDQLDDELSLLERQGIITPISFSKSASPVVWVRKPNGRYRMCIDFKATLNANIQSDAYPLPTVEEIFARIGNSCKFAKIDLTSAYSQIKLDEHAADLSVINTHRGLFRLERLQMGMKNSSAIFQKCMEQMLKGIRGVIVYQDDVMVCADSERQLKKRLGEVYKRLRENSVTVNSEKSIACSDSLKFLGFVFSAAGIHPDPSLTCKIADADVPKSPKDLAAFLGLVTYYAKFCDKFSDLCAPLHEAKKQEPKCFVWSDECERSFQLLKKKLTSAPVLQPFKLSKTTVVTVDASKKAVGCVLSQDGHPVLYVSRKLSPTETRYSNIEREALAVIWSCQRLKHFLLGKKFCVETDHKPLLYIFDPNQALKCDISPRLLRYSLKMMQFDYEIKYIAGKCNVVADALSRVDCLDSTEVPSVNFNEPCIPIAQLKQEMKFDRRLVSLSRRIISGDWGRVSRWEGYFKRISKQLTVDESDLVRFGTRVVPPQALHRRIL